MLRRNPRDCFSKMYHNYARFQRFQNKIVPEILRIQEAPTWFKISRFQRSEKIISQHLLRIPRWSNMFQDLQDLLRFKYADFPNLSNIGRQHFPTPTLSNISKMSSLKNVDIYKICLKHVLLFCCPSKVLLQWLRGPKSKIGSTFEDFPSVHTQYWEPFLSLS